MHSHSSAILLFELFARFRFRAVCLIALAFASSPLLAMSLWAHVCGEVNHETFDPQLDNDTVLWWKSETCPVANCAHFKNAKAWSMISEDKVVAYTKHHLLTCNAEGHQLDMAATDQLLEDVAFAAECLEWPMADRKQWQHDQDKWSKQDGRGTKRRGWNDSGDEAGRQQPQQPQQQQQQHGVDELIINDIATKVASQLLGAGFNPKAAPQQPPMMFPPPGLPARALGPPMCFGPQPGSSSSSVASVGLGGSPMGLGGSPMQLNIFDNNHARMLSESLARSENAIKAAMTQCVANARNLHNELQVVEEVRAMLRGAIG